MTCDITPEAVEAMCEDLLEGVPAVGIHSDNETELFDVDGANETMFEAAPMLREWCARAIAAEAEAAALREALQKAHNALAPVVGEVEITGMLAPSIYRTFGILIDALKETSDGL